MSSSQPQWWWADDSAHGHQDVWMPYSGEVCAELEKGLRSRRKKVRVDELRYVRLHWQDGKDMYQARYDNPLARRKLKREAAAAASAQLGEKPGEGGGGGGMCAQWYVADEREGVWIPCESAAARPAGRARVARLRCVAAAR